MFSEHELSTVRMIDACGLVTRDGRYFCPGDFVANTTLSSVAPVMILSQQDCNIVMTSLLSHPSNKNMAECSIPQT